jgi:hypothetical protein
MVIRIEMTIAQGTISYALDAPPVTGFGASWSDEELQHALAGPGADLLFDSEEVKTSGEASYAPQTPFGRTGLKQQMEDLRDKIGVRASEPTRGSCRLAQPAVAASLPRHVAA